MNSFNVESVDEIEEICDEADRQMKEIRTL